MRAILNHIGSDSWIIDYSCHINTWRLSLKTNICPWLSREDPLSCPTISKLPSNRKFSKVFIPLLRSLLPQCQLQQPRVQLNSGGSSLKPQKHPLHPEWLANMVYRGRMPSAVRRSSSKLPRQWPFSHCQLHHNWLLQQTCLQRSKEILQSQVHIYSYGR